MNSINLSRSVHLGNIPYNATEEDIGNMFSSCGVVTNVRIVYDRETNRPKGFGFCEFQDQQSAQNAVTNLNGAELHGRPLRVNMATK
uniref:RRM domain-containing protein n=1 Tax=Globodera pallida TaxID=36090 RepID=A0A183BLZ0_GLOPA